MSTETIAVERKKKILSPNDVRAHKNLYKVWKAYKAIHKCSQSDFAEEQLGWSQGNFSQYLTGQVAIGNKALATLCSALGCSPWEIREELADQKLIGQHTVYKDVFTAMSNIGDLPQEVLNILSNAKDQLAILESEAEEEQNIAA